MSVTAIASLAELSAGTALSAYGQYRNIVAEADMLKYQSEIAANNSALTGMEISLTQTQGQTVYNRYRLAVAKILSSQRTAFAASGVDISSGTPSEVLLSTAAAGETEALQVKQNTLLDIWRLGNQKQNYEAESGLLAQAAKDKRAQIWPTIAGTLLGGAGQGLSYSAPRGK